MTATIPTVKEDKKNATPRINPYTGIDREAEDIREAEKRSDDFLNEVLAAKCGATAFSI